MTTIENPMGTQPIKKLLMQLAIPAMIANVVNALYNIVDQIFIGQGVGY
ncbi:MAG: MATE family efflux transporter, partial [Granulicatella sp.]